MAKSAEDLALMLNVMAGFDRARFDQPACASRKITRAICEKPLEGLRIGLPKEYFVKEINDDVARAVEASHCRISQAWRQNGRGIAAQYELSVPVYYVLAPAEASSNLSRFDGVRYGYRAPEYVDLNDMYRKSRAQGFGAEVKRRILIGTYVLSHGYYDAYYMQAQKLRRLIAQDFAEAFKQCDVIMGPTSPTVAFDLGEKVSDPVQMYLSDAYTIAVNLAGLPGMSIPAGFGQQKQAGGIAHRRQLFLGSADAECGAPVPAGDRLAHAYAGLTQNMA